METASQLSAAFEFAARVHSKETWKVAQRPFLHHPLAVASLVLFYGGSESQAQAAFLHDTLGCGVSLEEIKTQFGETVSLLVGGFEDPPEVRAPGLEWSQVKRGYLRKIETLPVETAFVITCEELHELSCLNHDLKYLGNQLLGHGSKSYPVPGRDLGWYYKTLLSVLYKKLVGPKYQALLSELASQTKVLSNRVFEGIDN